MALEADSSRGHFGLGLSLRACPTTVNLIIQPSPSAWIPDRRDSPALKRSSEASVRCLFPMDRQRTNWSRIHYLCPLGRSVLGSPQDAPRRIKESQCDAAQAPACRSVPVGIPAVFMLPQNDLFSLFASPWKCGCSNLKNLFKNSKNQTAWLWIHLYNHRQLLQPLYAL